MSYDYEDGQRPKLSLLDRMTMPYWRFVLWCALDAKNKRLAAWGMRKLLVKKTKER